MIYISEPWGAGRDLELSGNRRQRVASSRELFVVLAQHEMLTTSANGTLSNTLPSNRVLDLAERVG
jgi:hypothetical protein